MKIIIKIFAISLLFFSISVNAQSFVVSNNEGNTLYLGVENPLIAIVEKMKCGSFFLATDNGKIREYENCRFIYNADSIGKANISIFRIKRNDTIFIGKSLFKVKELPKPIAKIRGKKSGLISKSILVSAGGILSYIEDFDIDILTIIKSYSVLIIKNNDSIYYKKVKGNKFTNDIIQEFSSLNTNEKVYFLDITVKWIKARDIELESLKFTIE